MRLPFAATLVLLLMVPALARAQQSLFEVEPAPENGAAEEKPAYPLGEQDGPWMVKVASFRGPGAVGHANALAKELRESHRIEAYVYRFQLQLPDDLKANQEYIQRFKERFGVRPRLPKEYLNAPEVNWVVLAGHFDGPDDRNARRWVKYLKKLIPKSVPEHVWDSMRYIKKDGTKSLPLYQATLTRNPLLPKNEVDGIDPDTARLLWNMNDDEPYTVFNVSAPITIMVKQFVGLSVTDKSKDPSSIMTKLNPFAREESLLDKAGPDAILLAGHLRKMGIEAYVYHGIYSSIVCVGGYQGPDDPRLLDDVRKLESVQVGELKLEPIAITTPRRPRITPSAN